MISVMLRLFSCFLLLLIPAALHAAVLFSDGFESGLGDWTLSGGSSLDSTTVHTGTYSHKSDRSAGATQAVHAIPTTSTGNLFLRYWIYVDGSGMDGKWLRFITQNDGLEAQLEVWATNNHFDLYWYNNYNSSACFTETAKYTVDDVIPTGEWVKVEVYLHYNTPGSSDGSIQVWVNRPDSTEFVGADAYRVQNQTSVMFRESGDCEAVYEDIHLPTGYNTGSPVLYFDDVEMHDTMTTVSVFNQYHSRGKSIL